jgi:hypothetical protein
MNIKYPLSLFRYGFFFWVHFKKIVMFDNMVHVSYTWDNMCSQGSIYHLFQNQM